MRPNCDLLNDRAERVIGDMPLLHMKKSLSFGNERNDR